MPVKKEKSTQSVKDLALLGINYANNKKEIKHLEAECTKMPANRSARANRCWKSAFHMFLKVEVN